MTGNKEIHPCDLCEYKGQYVCERPKGKECLQDKQYIVSTWQQLINGLNASYEQGFREGFKKGMQS